MASWETVVRDGVLKELLRQLTVGPSSWDGMDLPDGAQYPLQLCTFMDIENVRIASPMWRAIIDASPEFAALRLARFDYANEPAPLWETYKQFELHAFFRNWARLGTSWRLATPLTSRRLRLAPIGCLTCAELDTLRTALGNPMNTIIEVANGATVLPAADIWVTPHHRA